MIPRLKPYFGLEELRAILIRSENAVEQFENKFAKTFNTKHALAFSYGRSGLYALLKSLGIENSEVIMPAYTCVVVAHATVISGNIPRFIDIDLYDYNMKLEEVEEIISENTRAVIATHLFGYPLNVNKLDRIIKKAENKYGHKIYLIQDCAHSFGAEFEGKCVYNYGDAAIFGLNISKYISSIFGGMLTTNDDNIYERVKGYRDRHFSKPSLIKQFRKLLYLMAVYVAFNNTFYGFVNFLEENTPLLNRLTKYYREDRIDFPKDFNIGLGDLEARVGEVQLRKYAKIRRKREEIAKYYNEHLQGVEEIELPPIVEGATYSHYVPRVKNRPEVMDRMRREGIQLGQLIEYSVPHMEAYRTYKDGEFPNSYCCSQTTINLPNYPRLTDKDLIRIIEKIKHILANKCG